MKTKTVSYKSFIFFVAYIVCIFIVAAVLFNQTALFYGALISWINAGIYYAINAYHKRRIARYPSQALVVVISSTIVRFLIVGSLLIFAFRNDLTAAKPLIIGFVLGQIFFLIHQLLVAKNNGK